jgi:hypothetical protein
MSLDWLEGTVTDFSFHSSITTRPGRRQEHVTTGGTLFLLAFCHSLAVWGAEPSHAS